MSIATLAFQAACSVKVPRRRLKVEAKVEMNIAPTNLLAIIPSKSLFYPSIPIQTENLPINYFTLSLLDENGNKPNFNGMPFRISLRVAY